MGLYQVSPETEHDQALYLQARLVDVACLDCAAVVGVKKNSEHHTSVQWHHRDEARCPEFTKAATMPGGRHIYQPCSRLRASIEEAVADGRLRIGAEDGY